ncbi:MAG: O-antigen ligase family protein [Candidatus Sumerlaeia bacterium]
MEYGYSPYTIVLLLAVGLPLGVLNPWRCFLLSTLLLLAGNEDHFIFTRLPWLGPFANLNDVCVFLALWAVFFDWLRRRTIPRFPAPFLAAMAVILIGFIQTGMKVGWTYETLRGFRWALAFPLAYFIAANFHWDRERVRQFILVLFAGCFLAGFQHLLMVVRIGPLAQHGFARTISFLASNVPQSILVMAAIWSLPQDLKRRMLYILALSVMTLSTILSLTRSVWLATICTIPFAFLYYRLSNRLNIAFRLILVGILAMVIAIIMFQVFFPEINLADMILERFLSLTQGLESESSNRGRMFALKVEMQYWLESNWIFGQGLMFYQTIAVPRSDTANYVAFGHLGYITYLSQFGVAGLLVLGLYIPLSTIRKSRIIWQEAAHPEFRYLAGLSGINITFLAIVFAMSSSLLGLGYHVSGLLCGSVWILHRKLARGEIEKISDQDPKSAKTANPE